jgi:hypothetical protein
MFVYRVQVVLRYEYNVILVNSNLIYLIKQIKSFKLNPLILYWVNVGFASHVKNCLSLCRVSSSNCVETWLYIYIYKLTLTRLI